jgi:hypothetical protein
MTLTVRLGARASGLAVGSPSAGGAVEVRVP